MKHIKWLALLIAALFCLFGCAAPDVTFDLPALQEKSRAYTQNMIDGDFDTVSSGVAQAVAEKLSAQTLREGWEQTVSGLGSFEQIADSPATQTGAAATVDVAVSYTHLDVYKRQYLHSFRSPCNRAVKPGCGSCSLLYRGPVLSHNLPVRFS